MVLIVLGCAMAANAQYAAKVVLNSGNSFVVQKLNIRGDRLYSETGQAATSLSMVEAIEFRFIGLSLTMCENMFRSGDRRSLEALLDQYVGPVAQYSYLPGNLGDFLIWQLRVQYWNGNLAGAGNTIKQIRKTGNPVYTDAANVYYALLLIDQHKIDDAKAVFSNVINPEQVSVPMMEYFRGQLALDSGDYRQAMQHVSKIIAFYSRDAEWLPPATVLEARIYQDTGRPDKAELVADELMMAYPGTQWSKLGEKIKREATGKRGG
jgi:tetratricopeptide (TPR) repeat protein